MGRPSSIDKLPEEVRHLIGKLRGLGWTIDQIQDHLRHLLDKAPSRSALGRHIIGLDKLGERMRRSRDVAAALVKELGDAPESTAARVNIELIHSAVLDLFMKAGEEAGEGEGGEVDADGRAALAGNPEGVMMLAKALDHLARASKTNVDFVAAAEKRATEKARTEAATSAERVAREKGLSGETVDAIKAAIFGVKA